LFIDLKPYLYWIGIIIIACGIGIVADGIGSVLIGSGQYHNIWFDGERYIRSAAGVILIIIGMLLV
jgi:threonine/homoserine/homoserine lactone efflux protein